MAYICKTNSLPATIIKLSQGDGKGVILEHFRNYSRIRIDFKKVPLIPMVIANDESVIPECVSAEIIYYRSKDGNDRNIPEHDNMLLIECPHSMGKLERIRSKTKDRVIIYEPPDWSLHYDTIKLKYPPEFVCHLVKKTLSSFTQEKVVYDLGNVDALHKNNLVFTSKELSDASGLPVKAVERAIYHNFRGLYIKYYRYRLFSKPNNPALHETWSLLQHEKGNHPGNMVSLRSDELSCVFNGNLSCRPKGFKSVIKRLIKEGCIIKYDPVYVLSSAFKDVEIKSIYDKKIKELDEITKLVSASPLY